MSIHVLPTGHVGTIRCESCGAALPFSTAEHFSCMYCGSVLLLPKQAPSPLPADKAGPTEGLKVDFAQSMPERVLAILGDMKSEKWMKYYHAPDIPERKLENARTSCRIPGDKRILGLVDCTMFGSAKDCVVFTEDALYYHNLNLACAPNPGRVAYQEFPNRQFKKTWLFCVSVGGDQFFSLNGSNVSPDAVLGVLNSIKKMIANSDATRRFD